MQLAIIGPNLLDQSKGDFHVHAFGCADTAKSQYRLHQDDTKHAVEIASVRELVEYLYPSSEFDYDPETEWRNYISHYLFPCVGDLPEGG